MFMYLKNILQIFISIEDFCMLIQMYVDIIVLC